MRISVIIPVLNEERFIDQTLEHVLRSCRSAECELIVVDGGSSDRTREVAAKRASQVLDTPRPGRAAQMHAGALVAKGELLLFLHADTRLPEGWDVALWKTWSTHPKPGATAFRLSFDNPQFIYKALAMLAHWRSKIAGIVHGDQAIAVLRETYFAVGGFPSVPLMEEYYLLPKLRQRGRIVVLPEPIHTSPRRYERSGALSNAIRNTTIIVLHYCGVSPERLASFYQSPGRQNEAPASEAL